MVALAAGLAIGRLAIGTGLMVAPDLTLRTLGFKDPSPSTLAVARLAGGRDIVLGVAETLALARGNRRALLASTLAVAAADAGDTAIFGSAWASGEKSVQEASAKGAVSAGLATASALWVAWRLRNSSD